MADAIEQSNPLAGQTVSDGLRTGAAEGLGLAGRFVAQKTGFLQQIDLSLQIVGSPTGNITVGIYTDNELFDTQVGGFPADVDVTTVPAPQPPVAYKSFVWSANLPYLVAGTAYWIVITGDYSTSDTDYIAVWYSPVATYTGGKKAKYGSSWVLDATLALVFREWIQVGSLNSVGKPNATSISVGVAK